MSLCDKFVFFIFSLRVVGGAKLAPKACPNIPDPMKSTIINKKKVGQHRDMFPRVLIHTYM